MGLLGADRLDRRGFLKRFGIAGVVGGAGIVGRRELLAATNRSGGTARDHQGAMAPGGHAQHGGDGRLGGHGLGGGGFALSPTPAGVAAGAIAQVIWQIGRGMVRPEERSRGFGAAGLVVGFLVVCVTGLLT